MSKMRAHLHAVESCFPNPYPMISMRDMMSFPPPPPKGKGRNKGKKHWERSNR